MGLALGSLFSLQLISGMFKSVSLFMREIVFRCIKFSTFVVVTQ